MRFAERWLVVDVRARAGLDSSGGAEQVCGPSWSVTFMHVAGELYRWEFQLHDGEAEADLTTPRALGALLRPWTGRHDLAGLEIIRGTGYTFRAAVAAPVVVRRA
ncbi:hypothetical protein [Streptomyces sp. NPDC016845]|uniref:hypothetical protein n=1 Tax=Streptomyces sp. NPDC016845 TaxID=3364972 RepID=UPI0037BA8F7C